MRHMYKIWKPEYKSLNNAAQEKFDASSVRQKPTKNGWEKRAIKNALDDMDLAVQPKVRLGMN